MIHGISKCQTLNADNFLQLPKQSFVTRPIKFLPFVEQESIRCAMSSDQAIFSTVLTIRTMEQILFVFCEMSMMCVNVYIVNLYQVSTLYLKLTAGIHLTTILNVCLCIGDSC